MAVQRFVFEAWTLAHGQLGVELCSDLSVSDAALLVRFSCGSFFEREGAPARARPRAGSI